MKKRSSGPLSLSLGYRTGELVSCRSRATSFLLARGVEVDVISQVELALYEVLINVIEHVKPPSEKSLIRVTGMVGRGRIVFTISYRGRRFDLTKAPLPDIRRHFQEGKEGGLGIYIIRTLMDRVKYEYVGGRNVVTLAKTF